VQIDRRTLARTRSPLAWIGDELRRPLVAARVVVRAQGPRAVSLAVTLTGLTALTWLLRRADLATQLIDRVSAVSVRQPWSSTLVRVPGSLVVPAPRLPVWGALAQLLVVVGLAETIIGRRITLVAMLVTQYLTTFVGRAVGALDHSWLSVPVDQLIGRDTGPSAAVVALAVAVGVVVNARLLAGGLIVVLLVELVVTKRLASREHVAAVVIGLAIGFVVRRARERRVVLRAAR
jgi:hypothetical protein